METIYSIIIPHYNIPHLLKRCLWSIPKRDDTQIIVVDDKSSDDNIQILKSLEIEYNYVSFIYSETNGGGGRARNLGLSKAKGKYVLFADSDDFFNYCINKILDKYKSQVFDIVFLNANYIDSESYLTTNRYPVINRLMNSYERTHDTTKLRFLFGEPWCKIIRKDLIETHHIHFDETSIHNDTKFSYMIGFYASIIIVDNIAIYSLADRTQSVSKGQSNEKLLTRVKIFSEKNRFLKDNNIPIFDNLMLSSFKFYLRKHDFHHLNECFNITLFYGFSKKYIIAKLFIAVFKRLFLIG